MSKTADEYKQEGNTAFVAKDYQKAIDAFTKAIEVSETPNHVLYSNRSAAYTSSKQYEQALSDADECIKINPSWAKGYTRKGAALQGLHKYEEAEQCYNETLKIDPNNAIAKDSLAQIVSAQQSASRGFPGGFPGDMGLGELFKDPNLMEKLRRDPKVAELMNDQDFVAKINSYGNNPQALTNDMMTDPRIMQLFGALLGLNQPEEAASASSQPDSKNEEEPKREEPKKEAEPEAMEVDEEEQEQDTARIEADKAKAEGNKAYKARQFDEAISHYNQAWETFKDITYLNNRSAAEYEKGDYETCIKTLTEAVENARELRTDYKIVAKSFARMGNAYAKLDDLKKAIEYYQKSLTEHRTPDILSKLRKAEKDLKQQEAEAYLSPEKAEEARLEGKEYFTKADWPNAVKSYTEMIKRAPDDARGYSNRAAALAKLMSFPDAISDCNKAIEKDPSFIRAYLRKATCQIAVKEFAGAIETLDLARERDDGKNGNEINQLYAKASAQRFQPAEGNETPEETYARAMKDPEVAKIMQDPVMVSILQQAQNDPAALQEHMKNPEVFRKIQTLIAAGIIRTGTR
ncbi:hypothetical protein KAFR_0C05890 [Kazachstania africana CBS 2517]|uniref:STI1 domain-containing protein n=1 Tax=Kazachstania africana (strain ATCC 22294 / BCRC 22015 / CBS 2517 / CECT 1963 / NBRC 1671 / NRRL Y-8276) TaxID=1071382 RepID=H2AT80_KAZAF|nr:hypothetical protein KAFR_0C05890 [Kazachstania africana CBS 2517]CCF57580.1 hypothetical protein KAFR_0C05890 [Kazachstania africana CBS 2517]